MLTPAAVIPRTLPQVVSTTGCGAPSRKEADAIFVSRPLISLSYF
jgi:hypothetical protein